MDDDIEPYAFHTNEDVIAAVKSLRSDVSEHVPAIIWAAQIDQLASGVRNHIEVLGHDTSDMSLMHGMLYGTMLAINLEAQTSEVSTSTIMLASVLLDMIESPDDFDGEVLGQLRSAVDRRHPLAGFGQWLSRTMSIVLRSILG